MKKRIIAIFLACITLFAVGCGNKYNAQLYTSAEKWLDKDFINENKVRAFYKMDDPLVSDDGIAFDRVYHGDAPTSLSFVFNDQKEFEQAFIKYDGTIDFEKQTVLLYIFANIYPRKFKIKKIAVNGDVADIEIYMQKRRGIGDATAPTPAYFMIVCDKLAITQANFSIA